MHAIYSASMHESYEFAPAAEVAIFSVKLDGENRVVLLVPEVARLLRVSSDVVYTLIRSGQLRVRNLHPGSRNSRYLIPVAALVEYLQGRDAPIPGQDAA